MRLHRPCCSQGVAFAGCRCDRIRTGDSLSPYHESDLDEEEEASVHAVREHKIITRQASRTNQMINNKPVVPRSARGRGKDKHDRGALNADAIKKKMDGYGVETSFML
eukprot:scaffold153398_cov24-Attheya_sp.AAC.1